MERSIYGPMLDKQQKFFLQESVFGYVNYSYGMVTYRTTYSDISLAIVFYLNVEISLLNIYYYNFYIIYAISQKVII